MSLLNWILRLIIGARRESMQLYQHMGSKIYAKGLKDQSWSVHQVWVEMWGSDSRLDLKLVDLWLLVLRPFWPAITGVVKKYDKSIYIFRTGIKVVCYRLFNSIRFVGEHRSPTLLCACLSAEYPPYLSVLASPNSNSNHWVFCHPDSLHLPAGGQVSTCGAQWVRNPGLTCWRRWWWLCLYRGRFSLPF